MKECYGHPPEPSQSGSSNEGSQCEFYEKKNKDNYPCLPFISGALMQAAEGLPKPLCAQVQKVVCVFAFHI